LVEAYFQAEIMQPADGAQLDSSSGEVSVRVGLVPALGKGHSLRLLVDDAPSGPSLTASRTKLQGIVSGPHTLVAQVVDERGRELIRSPLSRFSLRPEAPPPP
jgi:hypothetical protein